MTANRTRRELTEMHTDIVLKHDETGDTENFPSADCERNFLSRMRVRSKLLHFENRPARGEGRRRCHGFEITADH